MVVQIERKGRTVTGLHIGLRNVQRYFPAGRQSVDLVLGHLQICCKLPPAFWRDEPSISDPRLNLWLTAKAADDKQRQRHAQMSLIPAEGESFRLEFKEPQPA
ncbi:MAG TPA: hypothetical protein VL986_12995 [Terracidiphilus sp.]|nr:hypothetical protein [Terracidiphilus sp.]